MAVQHIELNLIHSTNSPFLEELSNTIFIMYLRQHTELCSLEVNVSSEANHIQGTKENFSKQQVYKRKINSVLLSFSDQSIASMSLEIYLQGSLFELNSDNQMVSFCVCVNLLQHQYSDLKQLKPKKWPLAPAPSLLVTSQFQSIFVLPW